MTNPIEKWHEIVKSGNTDLLSDILGVFSKKAGARVLGILKVSILKNLNF